MLVPLEEELLAALVPNSGDEEHPYLRMARRSLEEDRDLGAGVSNLLRPWRPFGSILSCDSLEDDWSSKGKWHIKFLVRMYKIS